MLRISLRSCCILRNSKNPLQLRCLQPGSKLRQVYRFSSHFGHLVEIDMSKRKRAEESTDDSGSDTEVLPECPFGSLCKSHADADHQMKYLHAFKGHKSENTSTSSNSSNNRGNVKWSEPKKSLWVLHDGSKLGATSVVAFDLDSTLVVTKSGRKFGQTAEDWKFMFPNVKSKIQELLRDNVSVVIVTNQGGANKPEKLQMLQRKLQAISAELQRGCDKGHVAVLMAAGSHSAFRKPNVAMWEYIEEELSAKGSVDRSKSKYVGDAAGRRDGWAHKKKKDFSSSDRAFAWNVGVEFRTPEEFFLGEKPTASWDWKSVDAAEIAAREESNESILAGVPARSDGKTEMIIMVGSPASGKSTIAKALQKQRGYVRVNRDELKTPKKCKDKAREALKTNQSVVIDNTNPSTKARREYLDIAKQLNVPTRCFYMATPPELAAHMNTIRGWLGGERVPGIAINMYKKNFEQPQIQEGFESVSGVEFVPVFEDANHKRVFCMRSE